MLLSFTLTTSFLAVAASTLGLGSVAAAASAMGTTIAQTPTTTMATTHLPFSKTTPTLLSQHPKEDVTTIAIVRTFAPRDATGLAVSFDVWKEFPPCYREKLGNRDDDATHDDDHNDIINAAVDAPLSYTSVELYLSFSQSLEDHASLMADISVAVNMAFVETHGWGGCVDKVVLFGCDIDANDDIYQRHASKKDPLWVNGPNLQFRRSMRALQRLSTTDLVYLMEPDSVPIKPYWVDILVDEVKKQPIDFAVLGSKVRMEWHQKTMETHITLERAPCLTFAVHLALCYSTRITVPRLQVGFVQRPTLSGSSSSHQWQCHLQYQQERCFQSSARGLGVRGGRGGKFCTF